MLGFSVSGFRRLPFKGLRGFGAGRRLRLIESFFGPDTGASM